MEVDKKGLVAHLMAKHANMKKKKQDGHENTLHSLQTVELEGNVEDDFIVKRKKRMAAIKASENLFFQGLQIDVDGKHDKKSSINSWKIQNIQCKLCYSISSPPRKFCHHYLFLNVNFSTNI